MNPTLIFNPQPAEKRLFTLPEPIENFPAEYLVHSPRKVHEWIQLSIEEIVSYTALNILKPSCPGKGRFEDNSLMKHIFSGFQVGK